MERDGSPQDLTPLATPGRPYRGSPDGLYILAKINEYLGAGVVVVILLDPEPEGRTSSTPTSRPACWARTRS
jgi:hypothetical protein